MTRRRSALIAASWGMSPIFNRPGKQAHMRSRRVSFLRHQCTNRAGRDNSCHAFGKQGRGGQRHDPGLINADERNLLHVSARLGRKPV